MMLSSLNLLDPMGEIVSVTGNPVRAAGWYGPTTGLHSICIRVLNFQGRIGIQATLARTPSEQDWFSVLPNGEPYWQYPRPDYIVQSPSFGETSNIGFNFTCNAVWVRASVDRAYFAVGDTPLILQGLGSVDSILINY
jgi:hypothetical protein